MRLPNGYGSIYKLSGKRRRPYAAMVTTGWTDEGKPIRKYLGYYEKRQAALDALAEYNTNPYNIDDKKITLAELWEKWKAYRQTRKQSIQGGYISAFRRCKSMHNMAFNDINSMMIQAAVDDISDHPPSARLIKVIFNLLYKYAMLMGIADKNCAIPVETPTINTSNKHKPFSDKELAALWKHQDDFVVKVALVLCYTGMRPTELIKMKNADVHITERYMVGGIKTKAGKNRVIPISKKILPIITEWHNNDNKFLLVDPDGNHTKTWLELYNAKWMKSTIPEIMNHFPHDGRHTCKTRLDNAEVNKTTSKLILGHSSGDVSERVYTHKTTKQLIEAIDLI